MAAANEAHAIVRAALDALPQGRQEAFRLKFQDGLTYREIADVMGVSLGTVSNHITSALTAVRARTRPTLRPGPGDGIMNHLNDEVLTRYALGELDDAERATVDKALANDAKAQATLREIEAAVNLSRAALAGDGAASLTDAQRNAVVAKATAPRRVTFRRMLVPLAAGIALVAGAAVMYATQLGGQRAAETPLQMAQVQEQSAVHRWRRPTSAYRRYARSQGKRRRSTTLPRGRRRTRCRRAADRPVRRSHTRAVGGTRVEAGGAATIPPREITRGNRSPQVKARPSRNADACGRSQRFQGPGRAATSRRHAVG